MAKPFEKKMYFAMTLDPVHIGTGGYRLGRVDNTITREPGTNLPKIPGSSIAGVTRAYTAMSVQQSVDKTKLYYKTKAGLLAVDSVEYKKMKYLRPKYVFNANTDPENLSNKIVKNIDTKNPDIEKDSNGKEKYYSCAGKGADDGEGHCGKPDCEVCVSFGFSRGKSGSSFQGLAQFYDARILFFPVHSMIGPVWITCPSIMQDFGNNVEVNKDKFKSINSDYTKSLNFGWLMLESDGSSGITIDFSFFDNTCSVCNEIKDRAFLISDKLFSRIINDNLEVRTSVAIDPATGAAEDGALYTYEAIPRATVMCFDVVYNNPEYFRINGDKAIDLTEPANYLDPLRNPEEKDQVGYLAFNVEKGLAYIEHLGVGGMNTRGMGRLRILNMGGQSNGNS